MATRNAALDAGVEPTAAERAQIASLREHTTRVRRLRGAIEAHEYVVTATTLGSLVVEALDGTVVAVLRFVA